jgi:hypothetical protein
MPDQVSVTQEDIDLAEYIISGTRGFGITIRSREHPAILAAARHRQAAVQKARADALGEAVEVAERVGGDEIPLPGSDRQMHGTYAQGAFAATQAVAAAIRSLTEREVSRTPSLPLLDR